MNKLEASWATGLFVGIREESGEAMIGAGTGVIRVRSFRRKADENERWSKEVFDRMIGTPWCPVPGRDGVSVPPPSRLPTDVNEEVDHDIKREEEHATREVQRRRLPITR